MRAAEIDVEAMVESKSPATSFERFAYLNVSRECCGGYLVGVREANATTRTSLLHARLTYVVRRNHDTKAFNSPWI